MATSLIFSQSWIGTMQCTWMNESSFVQVEIVENGLKYSQH